MADEATDALVPEVPSTEDAAPQQEAPAPDPYKDRYESLRPQWDRTNALLDRARKGDVDAIRELGFDVDEPEPEPEPEYDDPITAHLTPLQKELEELKAWKAEQQAEALANFVGSSIDRLAASAEVSLDDDDKTLIFQRAVAGGNPNKESVEAAFKAHVDYLTRKIEAEKPKWLESKHADRPGTGQAALKDIDFATASEAEIHAWMEARMQGGPTT